MTKAEVKKTREAEKLARVLKRAEQREQRRIAREAKRRARMAMANERAARSLDRRPLGLPLAEMVAADRQDGYRSGTFVSWDLGTSPGERLPSAARGAGHQQGWNRAGRWATDVTGLLGYGESFAWLEEYDDGVYADDDRPEPEADPIAFAVNAAGTVEGSIEPEELVHLRGEEFKQTRDRLARRVGRWLVDGDESYHTFEVNDPEAWAMAVEEIAGRPLAPMKSKAAPPAATPERTTVQVQHGRGRKAMTEVTVTDTADHERRLLSLNGEDDRVYRQAAVAFARADLTAFCQFVESLDALAKAGYDASRVRAAIAKTACSLKLTPEQKFMLRQRMSDKRKTAALRPLVPALS